MNDTMNSTLPTTDIKSFTMEYQNESTTLVTEIPVSCGFTWDYVNAIGCLVLGIIIVIENVGGVLVIWNSPPLRGINSYIFVVSMAGTDIVVGAAMTLLSILVLVNKSYPFNYYGNIVMVIVIPWASMALLSLVHIGVVAVERYVFIAQPFFYRRYISRRVIHIIVATIWFIDFLYLGTVTAHIMLVGDGHFCDFSDLPLVITHEGGIPVALICSLVACIAYLEICFIAFRRKKSKLHSRQVSDRSGHSATDSNGGIVSESMSQVMKTIKYFSLVFGVTMVLTVPSLIVEWLKVNAFVTTPKETDDVFGYLVFLNSTTNFIILALVNKTFRQSLKTLIGCFKRDSRVSMSH